MFFKEIRMELHSCVLFFCCNFFLPLLLKLFSKKLYLEHFPSHLVKICSGSMHQRSKYVSVSKLAFDPCPQPV